MTDYRTVADGVRDFIEGIAHTPDQATAALADAYAAACREANARLRHCSDLLRQGMRSEALRQAQRSPDLLDMVASLDVPDVAVWENACAVNDLPRAPHLLVEIAAELNEAFAVEQATDGAMNELRRLVLARAPAMQRLKTVRRIAAIDVGTPHWTADAGALEHAALATARSEATEICARQDGAAARALLDDLTTSDWTVIPPGDLVDPLAALAVRSLIDDAKRARAADDVRAAKGIVKEIARVRAAVESTLPSSLTRDLGDLESWLSDSKQLQRTRRDFKELCDALIVEAAHEPARPEIVRALWVRLQQFDRPIPAEVQRAYARGTRASRTRSTIAFAAVVLVLVVLFVVGLMNWLNRRPPPPRAPQPSAATTPTRAVVMQLATAPDAIGTAR